MQNAKCKIVEAFRLRESLFHGKPRLDFLTKRFYPKKGKSLITRLRFLVLPPPDFAFCILHFGRSPINPNWKGRPYPTGGFLVKY